MRTRFLSLFSLVAVLSLLLMPAAYAQQPTQPRRQLDRADVRKPQLTDEQRKAASAFLKQLHEERQAGKKVVSVVVELEDEAVIPAWQRTYESKGPSAALAIARSQGAKVTSAQSLIAPQIKALGGAELYRAQRTANVIAVQIPVENVKQLFSIPGVKNVQRIHTKKVDNISGVSLIGSTQLWEAYGLTGEGVSIGIVDTGIDYTHTNFGGEGLDSYEANDPDVIGDLTDYPASNFPTEKVVGGWDFAGDQYNPSLTIPVPPLPDADPMDCDGHGSHVAGSAAGYGVNDDGSTYTGAYTSTVGTPDTMRIGPGSAPEADLYALRVFGCAGGTNLAGAAVEWATDPNGDFDFSDHLDVLNLSLGSDYSSADEIDPEVIQYNNAISAGVIVVGAAGNAADSFYINGGPGIVDRGISVAASTDALEASDGFEIDAPAAIAGVYPAGLGSAYPWALGGVTDNVVYPSSQSTGCAAFNAQNTALISGNIVLLDWTENECGSGARGNNVEAAGGTGMIIVYDDVVMGISILGSDLLPSIVTNNVAGDAIKGQLEQNIPVVATLNTEYQAAGYVVVPELEDTIASFSSRGPRRLDNVLKPDISAPGVSIVSTGLGTGNVGYVNQGTSMASPHIAGVMAQLRQLHPTWSIERLKALLMNGAVTMHDLDGDPYSPSRQGAGRADVSEAADTPIVAYNADGSGLVSLSYGAPEVIDEMTYVENIRVVNTTSSSRTYNISVTELVTSSGVSVETGYSSITLSPFGSRTIPVMVTVVANEIDWTMDDTMSPTAGYFESGRPFLNEHAGLIELTSSTAPSARVPFHIAPRPASDMHVVAGPVINEAGTYGELLLGGTEVDTEDYVGLAWALELQDVNVDDPFTTGSEQAADIQYVGVGSDVAYTGVITDETTIFFGISTYAPHTTPQGGFGYAYDINFNIYIDTDQDGTDDYWMFIWNLNQLLDLSPDPDEEFLVFTIDLSAFTIEDFQYVNYFPYDFVDTGLYNTSMIVMPVWAGALGLTDGDSEFDYWVESTTRESLDTWSDVSSTHTYDPANPAVETAPYSIFTMPVFFDVVGEPIGIDIDETSPSATDADGLLILHSLNAEPNKAEWVDIGLPVPADPEPAGTGHFLPMFHNTSPAADGPLGR